MTTNRTDHAELFIEDALERMSDIEDALMALEDNADDKNAIDSLFRATHTLKGNASSAGLEPMSELSHEMETLMDMVRSGSFELTDEAMDCMFRCKDRLAQVIDDFHDGGNQSVGVEDLVLELRSFAQGADISENSEDERGGLAEAMTAHDIEDARDRMEAGGELWIVKARFSPDAVMTDVSMLVVINGIKEFCDVIKCAPDPASTVFVNERLHYEMLIETDPGSADRLFTISHRDIEKIDVENAAELIEAALSEAAAKVSTEVEAVAKGASSDNVGGGKKHAESSTVRVETARLDALMNLVGELVTNRTRFKNIHKDMLEMDEMFDAEDQSSAVASATALRDITTAFDASFQLMSRVINELQDKMMKIRMVPIGSVFRKFERIVRDLSKKTGKKVELKIAGGSTELDKTVIDMLADPLLHMVRNAMSHGIESPEERVEAGKSETGILRLSAGYEGGSAKVTISDDGRGMDHEKIRAKAVAMGMMTEDEVAALPEREALNLIFTPAFSTQESVNDVSGRGVGMDVVLNNIKAMNGLIDLQTRFGEGTVFTLKLPLTLAIFQAIIIRVGAERFAVSLVNITEIVKIKKSNINKVEGRMVAKVRNSIIPLFYMSEILGSECDRSESGRCCVLIAGVAEKKVGLIVDALVGRQEIVIKKLGPEFQNVKHVAGASIMGDGSIILALDLPSIIKLL